MKEFPTLFKLYFPFITFLLLISIFFCINEKEALFELPFGLSSFFSVSFSINNKVLFKEIYFLVCLLSLLPYLFYDFSSLFPKQLQMEVFFDVNGIEENVNIFTKDEISKLKINLNPENYRYNYYLSLDKVLLEMLKVSVFTNKDSILHSKGSTSFIVKKNNIISYVINESKGNLEHRGEKPNSKDVVFKSFFDKMPSKHDYIKFGFKDLFIKRYIILKPMFKQIIAEKYKSDGVEFDHILFGLTKVHFFPFPSFSNTLYCLESEDRLHPIGYAIYSV